jgi:signal peptidase II
VTAPGGPAGPPAADRADQDGGDRDARPSRLPWSVFALALVVLAVDQATKLWAVAALSDRDPMPVLGELIRFELTYNSGAAFSIGAGFTPVFTLVAGAAVAGIGWTARRVRSRAWAVALGLLLGGATTHLLDRLFREPGFARGHVVDFINYGGLFVGNVADIALVCGVGLLILYNLRGLTIDGRPRVG